MELNHWSLLTVQKPAQQMHKCTAIFTFAKEVTLYMLFVYPFVYMFVSKITKRVRGAFR